MDITCHAKTTLWHPNFRKIYSCNIVRADLRGRYGDTVINFDLIHDNPDKSDQDVEAVVIIESKLSKIPHNFQELFENLTILCIKQCNLEKIERKDLRNFINLKEVWMPNNKIKELPENLFVDHPEIEKISFSNNKISIIGEKILDGLDDLKYANFNRNLTIDVTYDAEEPRISLMELKEIIRCNCKGITKSIFKTRKRNFSFMRNSLDNNNFISSNTETISSIQNISCGTSNSTYNMIHVVQNRRLFSSGSGSVNSQQSFQRVHYVANRHRKRNTVHQETQTDKKTFTDDLNKFLFRENFKDFAIKNDQKTFNVHKFVLAARSPVVCTMIEKNPAMRGIELLNANNDMIEHLLDFIYEDQLPQLDEFNDFLKIYDLSMKLELNELADYSRKKILGNLNTENAIEALEVAAKHDDKELKAMGMEKIQKLFPQRKFKARLTEDSKALKGMIEELKIMKKKIEEATLQFNQLSFFESQKKIEADGK